MAAMVNGTVNETNISEGITEQTVMAAMVEESSANDSMVFQRPPLKSSVSFRQQKS